MFKIQTILFIAFLGETGCNSLPNSQQDGGSEIAEELKTLQREFQESKIKLKATNKVLSELIITLLNSKDHSGDTESDRDKLVRKRRALSDENDDLLSQLPISSLLGMRCKDGKDGANGVNGVNGINGEPGRDGNDGDMGRDGRDGEDGKDGENGVSGKDGVLGRLGNPGEKGPSGEPGGQGLPGQQGRDGQAGEKGDSGTSGRKGDSGSSGQKGAPGLHGLHGLDGLKGAAGRPGENGNSGRDGQAGEKGDSGTFGRKGDSGSPGHKGAHGLDGLKGAAGRPGENRAPGESLNNTGSVYTRWGRTVCGNQSTLVYSGFTGGSRYDQSGGGVNYQCMPPTPEYNSYSSGGDYSALSGAEYQSYTYGIFPNQAHDKNVPCARCYTNTRPAVMMLPAKRTCPSGWTREYEGYLMSEYRTHNHPATFECVDVHPEYIAGSHSNANGALFYFVKPICSGTGDIGHCSSNSYINDRQLTCAVCSK